MSLGQPNQTITNRTKLILDILIFIGFLIAMEPRSSGIAVHEWLTLSALAAILIHLLLSWDWIAQVTTRFLKSTSLRSRINYVLNWLLFIDGILIMLSGILISEHAIPALGLHLPIDFAWRRLHDMSANLFLFILGLHTALHWTWIASTFRNMVFQPIGRLFASKKDQTA
jgi:hypothetical protein